MMMKQPFSLNGKFLIAMPNMGDQRFEKCVIYVCAHSDEGAMGFIINKTLESPNVTDFFSQLEIISKEEEIKIAPSLASSSLHVGGPVEPGRGFVLHTPEYESSATLKVGDGICLTATLEILRAIATGKGPENCMMALGYSGWASGQLEDEISSNGWLTADANTAIIFDPDNQSKYRRSLDLLGIDMSLLSSDTGHA